MSLGKAILALGGGVLLVFTASAAVLLAADEAEPLTAEQVLERSQEWLGRYDTVAFDSRIRFTDAVDDEFSMRLRSEGAVHFERGYRTVERAGFGFVTEILDLSDVVYYREAKTTRELPDSKWGKFDLGAEAERAGVVPFGAAPTAEAGGIAFTPTELRRLVAAIEEPRLDDRDSEGNEVVKGKLDIDSAFADEGAGVEGGDIELRATDEGDLRRIILELEQSDGDVRVDLRFSDWGEPVDLSPPSAADIDPTPDLQEEAIANFKDAPVLMPSALPDGWVITFADVLSEEETFESCRQVELDFDDPNDPDGQYLWLYEMPRSCADLDPPRDAEPFTAGRFVGWYAEESSDDFTAHTGQLLVGETVIAFDTDLDPEDLALILSDLRPIDFGYEPRVLTGVGQIRGA